METRNFSNEISSFRYLLLFFPRFIASKVLLRICFTLLWNYSIFFAIVILNFVKSKSDFKQNHKYFEGFKVSWGYFLILAHNSQIVLNLNLTSDFKSLLLWPYYTIQKLKKLFFSLFSKAWSQIKKISCKNVEHFQGIRREFSLGWFSEKTCNWQLAAVNISSTSHLVTSPMSFSDVVY